MGTRYASLNDWPAIARPILARVAGDIHAPYDPWMRPIVSLERNHL
jgi:hypothetical protein